MAGDVEVASLFGALGLKVDRAAWRRGDEMISGMKTALAGVAAYFGGQFLGKSLISFNANVEDTKTQIAGMLALAKHTNLSEEVGNAEKLFANLQARAAKLPGITSEYTQMAGMLTQPITDAGLGLKDLEDFTVNAVVAAKALGVEWGAAARDVDQALRGQFHANDVFTGKLLGSKGFKGEEGRSRFNAMDAKTRAATLQSALMQKQIGQLAEVQGQNFSGVLSTIQDAIQQFLGKVGLPIFRKIGEEFRSWTKWLEQNSARVDAFAASLASGLSVAFDVVKASVMAVAAVIDFFIEHAEIGKAVLIALGTVLAAFAVDAAIAWAVAFGPVVAAVAAIAAVVLVVRKMIDAFRNGSTAVRAAIAAIGVAIGVVIGVVGGVLGPVGLIAAGVSVIVENWEAVKEIVLEVRDAIDDMGNALFITTAPNLVNAEAMLAQQQQDRQFAPGSNSSISHSTIGDTHITAPITITGVTDPHAVGRAVKEHLDEHTARAYEHVKGGRR